MTLSSRHLAATVTISLPMWRSSDGENTQAPPAHRDIRYICCPHLVRLIDRLAAQQIRIDFVLRMRLAGVPLWADRPQPKFAHQPSDAAPTPDGDPLAQQRHLQSTAAIHRMLGENPIEPVQKIERIRRCRSRLVVEAAARNAEQAALQAYTKTH